MVRKWHVEYFTFLYNLQCINLNEPLSTSDIIQMMKDARALDLKGKFEIVNDYVIIIGADTRP